MLTLHPKRAPSIHWHVQPESWAGLGEHKAGKEGIYGGCPERELLAGLRCPVSAFLQEVWTCTWESFFWGPSVSYMSFHVGSYWLLDMTFKCMLYGLPVSGHLSVYLHGR